MWKDFCENIFGKHFFGKQRHESVKPDSWDVFLASALAEGGWKKTCGVWRFMGADTSWRVRPRIGQLNTRKWRAREGRARLAADPSDGAV